MAEQCLKTRLFLTLLNLLLQQLGCVWERLWEGIELRQLPWTDQRQVPYCRMSCTIIITIFQDSCCSEFGCALICHQRWWVVLCLFGFFSPQYFTYFLSSVTSVFVFTLAVFFPSPDEDEGGSEGAAILGMSVWSISLKKIMHSFWQFCIH